jgi:catechol 2,3-dioxygenase-like lactoylglutathione lyase family enzyme
MASMPSGIDHVVIAVADPDSAAAELTEKVGVVFTGGGRHAGLGTFNRIAFLGDAYLELMGVANRDEATGWPMGAAAVRGLERGGGFVTYALVDKAIRITVPRLEANGSRLGPVTQGSRERPDGELVEWWSAAAPELGPDQPPFLIKHLEVGPEWGADALAARRAFQHPIGGPVALLGIRLAVPDPIGLAAACFHEVGLEFQAIGPDAVATLGRHTIRIEAGASADVALTVMLGVAAAVSRRAVSAFGVDFELAPAVIG